MNYVILHNFMNVIMLGVYNLYIHNLYTYRMYNLGLTVVSPSIDSALLKRVVNREKKNSDVILIYVYISLD